MPKRPATINFMDLANQLGISATSIKVSHTYLSGKEMRDLKRINSLKTTRALWRRWSNHNSPKLKEAALLRILMIGDLYDFIRVITESIGFGSFEIAVAARRKVHCHTAMRMKGVPLEELRSIYNELRPNFPILGYDVFALITRESVRRSMIENGLSKITWRRKKKATK